MHRNLVFILPILFGPAIGFSLDDSTDKEIERLQGEWELTRSVREGEEQKEVRGHVHKIKGNRYIPSRNSEDYATISVNPGAKPQSIDLKDRQGNIMLGIYKLENGVLSLCMARSGMPRPKEFTSNKESKTFLIEMKRRPE
jgi:uncharacterized protein (TIGR03067 family)